MRDWIPYFHKNIRYLRRTCHMTRKEMALVMGISVSTLGRIEKDGPMPRVNCQVLYRLCEHFGLSGDVLLYCSLEDLPPA